MRRLKRAGRGRAAVVVPQGTLFGDGISARIKADLLEKFNLHTVVRLREGVFAPYTDIPANLIFFDTNGPTKDIWYYELPLPEGRKKYSKTAPMAYEEFGSCLEWWIDREENERAWKVSATDLIQRDEQGRVTSCNLDIKNPHMAELEDQRTPKEIIKTIVDSKRDILEQLVTVQNGIDGVSVLDGEPTRLGQFLTKSDDWVTTEPDSIYKQITVRLWGKGLVLRGLKSGSEIAAAKQVKVTKGQFLMSRIDARHGAFGIVPEDLNEALVSNDFPAFIIDSSIILPHFFEWITRTEGFVDLCRRASEGSTNRVRLKEEKFLDMRVPVPTLEQQKEILDKLDTLASLRTLNQTVEVDLSAMIQAMLHEVFSGGPKDLSQAE